MLRIGIGSNPLTLFTNKASVDRDILMMFSWVLPGYRLGVGAKSLHMHLVNPCDTYVHITYIHLLYFYIIVIM